ncbi:beta-glucosidase [Mangrovivirga sp. M17]|uniref:Beta-glucosidase n=1 Tax=Mangrovivirga halotolerans TaxID=2993936 RepID=A0ABT3RKC6_9BACT|nr:glucoamylase family protein [Mangrovivirga halotolerans]MCX2742292.1 beta-glucosidase [Mangrovivirga halotolerans]
MKKNNLYIFATVLLIIISVISSCQESKNKSETSNSEDTVSSISDDSLYRLIHYRTFQYFWEGAEPNSGMARERLHVDGIYPQNDAHIVTTGGSGFGIMAILSGIEQDFITRKEGFQRLNKIVSFLESADRFHGIFPHWLNGESGKVKPFSKFDDGADGVESAFLFQGLLTVGEYFKEGNKEEKDLVERINKLWAEAEWNWFTKDENVLYWHWSPNVGWKMNHQVRGYNECLIYYILAASSPTYSIDPEVYHEGWARGGDIKSDQVTYGYELPLKSNGAPVYGGPLFWAHYSYLGLDPNGLEDQYANYWKQNKNHTLINRQWCIENPENFEGYGENCWGLTASYTRKEGGETGYKAHAPGRDNGTISPTAALSSIPYTPEYSMETMRGFYDQYGDQLLGPYGFYDAFNPEHDWFIQRYLAIDQGPIAVMMENHKSGLLWKLFMQNEDIQKGLKKLGFKSPHFDDSSK